MQFFNIAIIGFALAAAAPVEEAQPDQGRWSAGQQGAPQSWQGGQGGLRGQGGSGGSDGFGGSAGFGGDNFGPPQPLCDGLRAAQCCQLDVGGVVAATCKPPPGNPWNPQSLDAACGSIGHSAQCCVLPAAGLALLCNSP